MARLLMFVFAGCLLVGGAAACGGNDDDVDDALDSAREQAEDVAGSAGARVAAEAMRGVLQAEALAPGETLRTMTVLQESADDLPGDPTVTGIEDADGDGKDDDGKVEFAAGDQRACVTVADNGEISVSGDAC
ncbi:MAG: hypothetical protein ACRDV7_14225 [Acidimicrobiia bacterium]